MNKEQKKKNQNSRKLKENHIEFLDNLIDNNLVSTLEQTVGALRGQFEGLMVFKSDVNKHFKSNAL